MSTGITLFVTSAQLLTLKSNNAQILHFST